MKKSEAYFKEIKKQYPKTMSKDQLYRVAHISKARRRASFTKRPRTQDFMWALSAAEA